MNIFDLLKGKRKKELWILHVPYLSRIYKLKRKPKKVQGGYMLRNGNRHIDLNVKLHTEKEWFNL